MIEIIKNIIKPESELEKVIINDEDFVVGALWGKPRNGHPEGKVIYHIGHVLKNIDNKFSGEVRQRLRLIAIIHDTFKNKVDTKKPKSGENHHAMIARRFAEKYISDIELLEIIELHDEAYNSWCKGSRNGDWIKAENRLNKLINRLGDSINLYSNFYECDNDTGDKVSNNIVWYNSLK